MHSTDLKIAPKLITRNCHLRNYFYKIPLNFTSCDFILNCRIDFSYINGLCKASRLQSQRTPTPYKIKVNNCKLIDLVIRVELTRALLMPRFTIFLKILIFNCRMFYYLKACFLRVTVSLLCWLQAVSKLHVLMYPYLV